LERASVLNSAPIRDAATSTPQVFGAELARRSRKLADRKRAEEITLGDNQETKWLMSGLIKGSGDDPYPYPWGGSIV
jgi:hypothetical protein